MNSFTDIYNKVVLPIYNKVSSGAFLYGYAVVALLLPNIPNVWLLGLVVPMCCCLWHSTCGSFR